jgi:hypothetical protein
LPRFTQRDDWNDDDGGEGVMMTVGCCSFADVSSFCGWCEMAFRWLGSEIWRSISRRCRRLRPPSSDSEIFDEPGRVLVGPSALAATPRSSSIIFRDRSSLYKK